MDFLFHHKCRQSQSFQLWEFVSEFPTAAVTLKCSHRMGNGRIFLKFYTPLSLIKTFRMKLILAGFISLDSTFNSNFLRRMKSRSSYALLFKSCLAERGRRSDNDGHSTSVEHQDDTIRLRWLHVPLTWWVEFCFQTHHNFNIIFWTIQHYCLRCLTYCPFL